MSGIAMDSLIVFDVLIATGVTDAVYVFLNTAVMERRRIRVANWSVVW